MILKRKITAFIICITAAMAACSPAYASIELPFVPIEDIEQSQDDEISQPETAPHEEPPVTAQPVDTDEEIELPVIDEKGSDLSVNVKVTTSAQKTEAEKVTTETSDGKTNETTADGTETSSETTETTTQKKSTAKSEKDKKEKSSSALPIAAAVIAVLAVAGIIGFIAAGKKKK